MNRPFQMLSLLGALFLLTDMVLGAETFQFADGTSITGEILSMDDAGLRLRLPDDTYSDRIPWTKFSQADLLRLQRNPKAEQFVTPFLEISEARRTEPRPVGQLKEPERLPRPGSTSVFGSLFRSPLGWFLLLLMYGANIYAGFEVAVYRFQPRGLVCGVSAVLPVLGPIIFLAMRSRQDEVPVEQRVAPVVDDVLVTNPMQGDLPAGQHSSLHLHAESPAEQDMGAELAPPEVFTRGQFTFNRRFFETRFPKFFGVFRGADKDKVLAIKSARREHVADRIVRITANEMVVQVTHGTASEEVTIPFVEIQEVVVRHKADS